MNFLRSVPFLLAILPACSGAPAPGKCAAPVAPIDSQITKAFTETDCGPAGDALAYGGDVPDGCSVVVASGDSCSLERAADCGAYLRSAALEWQADGSRASGWIKVEAADKSCTSLFAVEMFSATTPP